MEVFSFPDTFVHSTLNNFAFFASSLCRRREIDVGSTLHLCERQHDCSLVPTGLVSFLLQLKRLCETGLVCDV